MSLFNDQFVLVFTNVSQWWFVAIRGVAVSVALSHLKNHLLGVGISEKNVKRVAMVHGDQWIHSREVFDGTIESTVVRFTIHEFFQNDEKSDFKKWIKCELHH
jgi:hypothetical protein